MSLQAYRHEHWCICVTLLSLSMNCLPTLWCIQLLIHTTETKKKKAFNNVSTYQVLDIFVHSKLPIENCGKMLTRYSHFLCSMVGILNHCMILVKCSCLLDRVFYVLVIKIFDFSRSVLKST